MNIPIIYMLKVAAWITGFYSVYFLFLSRDTLYNRNRFYLVASSVISFLLPLVSVRFGAESALAYFGKTLSETVVTASAAGARNSSATFLSSLTSYLPVIYIAGVAFFGLKLLADFVYLAYLILRHRKKDTRIISFRSLNTAGFSAFGYIFLSSELNSSDREEIIRHEINHLSHKHSGDILIMELIRVFQWFNPVVHLTNRSLRAIHEYQADDECLQAGIPVSKYQTLLLNNVLRTRIFLSSNSFSNPSLLRKRLVMMHRSRSGRLAGLKTVLALPVAVLVFLILSAFETGASSTSVMSEKSVGQPETEFSKIIKGSDDLKQSKSDATIIELVPPPPPPPPPPSDKNSKKPEANSEVIKSLPADISTGKAEEIPPAETFVVVEEMPEFPGGEKALMDFIYNNISYPESAKERYIQGRVILKFVVTYEGKVDNISVLKSVDPALDSEAIRVVSLLPNWKPGKQKGKNVNVWYNVPVTFLLQEPESQSAMLKKLNEDLIRKYKSVI